MNEQRRSRRDLSLDEVVDRAIEIAQAEGETGLTMRRVADACDVTPMALYHHVANKEALLTAIVDRVVATAIADLGSGAQPWRTDLVEFLCRYRAGFIAHPTAAEVYLRRPILSPSLARCTELMFESFERAGLAGRDITDATDACVLLVTGSIANDLSRPPAIRHELTKHLPESSARRLNENIDAYSNRDAEAQFRQALNWLLDGLVSAHGGAASS